MDCQIDEKNAMDILNFLIKTDTINMSNVQQKVQMAKKEKILEKHPYSIWEGSDKKWRTYLPDETNKAKRKLIKRKSRDEIEDIIVKFYTQNQMNSFKNIFLQWKNRQEGLGRDVNTISKYESDYARYVKGSKIENKSIENITENEVIELLNIKLKELKLPYSSLKQFFWLIRAVFTYAYRERIITTNICDFIEIKYLKRYCIEKDHSAEKRVYSMEELKLLYNKLEDEHIRHPLNITTYAVQFAMLTGLRTGELAALKWSKIDYENKKIIIDSFEKRNRRTNTYEIQGTTKTEKIRIIPLTKPIEDLLSRIRREEMKYGFITEFVFSDEKGPINSTRISDCGIDKTRQAGIKNSKGIHALRRTLNSMLKADGVATNIVASMLGHSDEVNEKNYTYDVSQMDYKNDMLSKLNNQVLRAVINR